MRRLFYTSVLLPVAFLLAGATLTFSQPVFTIQNKKDACNNLSNGSFDILATSGTGTIEAFVFSSGPPIGPISITLNVPSNVSGLLGTIAGRDYLIVVTDNDGSSNTSIKIFAISNITASIVTSSNSLFCIAPNGAIDINVSGGTGNYAYLWTATNGFTSSLQDITGLAAGDYTVVVSDVATNCTRTLGPITITQPSPPVVSTPSATLCVGATMTASPGVGGTWVSNAPGIATINNAGLITGISAGSVTFTFTSTATGCTATTSTVNVIALPAVSTPSATLCIGATMTASPVSGGTWISSNPTVATITNAGLITGVTAGAATFTFTSTGTGCNSTTSGVTVNALPVVSTPSATLCIGIIMPASPAIGGTWISSNPSAATITNAGSITGVTAGTATFTFTNTATGCSSTTPGVTVNALPVVSTPSATLCIGVTMTASPVAGGTWVSSNPAVAIITNAGIITGVTAGAAAFTFTNTATGCSKTTSGVTVNALPVVSTPLATLCIGVTMTGSPVAGGTWVSSNPAVASITNAGIITGVTAGAAAFTFTSTGTGCSSTTSGVTVNALPVVSTPSAALCIGVIMPASPAIGGTWISSNPAVATITNAGLITGVTAGAAAFTFTSTGTGCSSTTSGVTVNALPVVSTPSATLCIGVIMPASPAIGGTWVSSNPAVATITNAGIITGITAGTATFTFTNTTTGCSNTTSSVTVNALPVVSTPSATLCIGVTMTASPGTGGTWVSSNPAVATITNAGIITGVTAGTATFTFTSTTTGCSSTTSSVTVNALPVVSTPSATLCIGVTTTASPVTGGTWVSSNPTVATITNAGIITGVTAGTATFTFIQTTTGCISTTSSVSVNESPTASISGAAAICSGSTANLQIDFTGAGPWAFQYSDGVTIVSGNSPTASLALLVSPSATTTYTLISVTDANCVGTIIGAPAVIAVENVPLTNLAVSADFSPVCSGGSSSIKIANSEVAVSYQLRNDADNSLIGSAVTGTGGVISLPTGALTVTTSFNVLATRGVCAPVQLLSMSVLTVAVSTINTTLSISAQQTPLCAGSGTNIQIVNSEAGVSYQLRDDSDNSAVGVAVAGTGGTIDLPTGNLLVTKIFNVLAANGTCSIELSNLVTVNVDVNPDPSLVLAATISPLCIGGSSVITVAASESGVNYQLRNDADDSPVGAAVAGSGASIQLPTGVLSATTTFNVLATGGVCIPVQLATTIVITVSGSVDLSLSVTPPSSSICPGAVADFQISGSETGVDYTLIDVADNSLLSAAVSGTGGTITISTIPLASAKNIKVLATNGSCSAELTTMVSVSINPSPETALTVSAVANTVCSGESTLVEVINSEAGVTYQLRDDADDSNVSGVVTGNGSTISISTGILTNSKVFNVLATIGTCPAELLNTVSIIVNPPPDPGISIAAQDPAVCIGKSTFIQVINSEAGIIYQLRDNADNSIVSGASFGNGGTIFLPTGPLGTNRTFNVIASNVLCGIQLSTTVTVTLLAINDPLCSNCTTATVTTANLTKVTCNASAPDGSVEFLVNPPVPSIDLTGVKIQITGPTSKTQTNNFIFAGLAVGNYTYIVTYGDENNPDCIKTGSFIIELSREPDPVDFDLTVNDFNCDANKGSITLMNITGASSVDFQYTVFLNGSIWDQTAISSASTVYTVNNILLGDYEVQLTQNQESANGCLGTVSSSLVPFTIAEPAGGCDVFVPNVFTPNGDGTNDLFEVRHLPANSTLFITNRWGKEVFSSSDYQNNWTADNISDGIYYYRLVAEGEVLTGWVEILR